MYVLLPSSRQLDNDNIHNNLDNIVIFKLNGSLLKYNNY